VGEFIKYVQSRAPDVAQALSKAGGSTAAIQGSKTFQDEWRRQAREGGDSFLDLQHDFIRDTHYAPVANTLRERHHLDISQRSAALQDVVWSVAVQHGPGSGGKIKRKDGSLKDGVLEGALRGRDVSKMSDSEIINAIYDYRCKYWPPLKDSRYKEERECALKALAEEKPAGLPPFTPVAGVLGTHQAERAKKNFDQLGLTDRSKFSELRAKAASSAEAAYLDKALAVGHSVGEMATFAERIRGRDEGWLRDHLTLVGDSSGRGVMQQWNTSCNATSAQAVRGQLDPVYSLSVHDNNPNVSAVDAMNAMSINPSLAQEQQQMLTSPYQGERSNLAGHTGVATPRSQGGSGRFADDLFDAAGSQSGLDYHPRNLGPNYSMDSAITDINRAVDAGLPVPIVVGTPSSPTAHYVVVTARQSAPVNQYTIHDPWTGNTYTRAESDIRNGQINIANCNQMSSVESPSPP